MDSILSDEPSVHTLPDSAESESPSEKVAEPAPEPASEGEKPKPAVEVKASAKPVTAKVTDDDEDDEADDPAVEQNLEGLKRSLAASRGDKRKLKKQWREAEKRVEDTARQIAELKGQLTAFQQMGQRQVEPKVEEPKLPDFFGAPEEHLTQREKILREQFLADQKSLREQVREEQFKRDATRSERRMSKEHEDYNEAKAAFMAAVPNDPRLWSMVLEDPEPAEVVYAEGKRLLRGGKSEREAELEAKLAELEAKASGSVTETAKPVARPPIPKSIAGARGTGNSIKQAWSGPRSSKEIYGE